MNLTAEIELKTERLREMLAAQSLGGVLLNTQANFAWLTGGGSNAVNRSVENGVGTLLVRRDGMRFLLANNIEIDRLMAEQIPGGSCEPLSFDWRAEKSSPEIAADQARALVGNAGEIISDLPLSKSVRPAENLIAPCRYELTIPEIERFHKLGADTNEGVRRAFESIAPGMPEQRIATVVAAELAVSGIETVVVLVGADDRIGAYRHPTPTENVWKKSVLVAVCAKRSGLIASLTRIGIAGPVSAEFSERTEAVKEIQRTICRATEVGREGRELYGLLESKYAELGFADEIGKHHQGGAAGYKTREWVAHPKSSERVVANQAFAWNPSITGTKAEETMIVTAGGFEFITANDVTGIFQY